MPVLHSQSKPSSCVVSVDCGIAEGPGKPACDGLNLQHDTHIVCTPRLHSCHVWPFSAASKKPQQPHLASTLWQAGQQPRSSKHHALVATRAVLAVLSSDLAALEVPITVHLPQPIARGNSHYASVVLARAQDYPASALRQ
eukprot:6491612-Amphidinium_carterae.2